MHAGVDQFGDEIWNEAIIYDDLARPLHRFRHRIWLSLLFAVKEFRKFL
jgi:hypothetical protein